VSGNSIILKKKRSVGLSTLTHRTLQNLHTSTKAMTRRAEQGYLRVGKKSYLGNGMRYLALVLGSSLGLRWLPAKPVEAIASTGMATDRIVTGDCLQEGPKREV